MTWYWDREGTGDVYDHTGSVVGNIDPSGSYTFPDDVLAVMRSNMDGSGQPTAYNQNLIADAATENIEIGTPP